VTVVAGSELAGIELTVVEGAAALTVAPRNLATLASLEKMEITVPALRDAPDGPIPPERARLRRGRLQSAVITVDEPRLRAALAPEALAGAGISDLSIALEEGRVRLRGRAAVGKREADFTARVSIAPASGRRARLTIDDVRLYAFLPVAAPLVGGAILAASPAGGGARAGGARALHWTVDIDVLDLAIYETFAAWGWRLPDISGARLAAVTISPSGIRLSWRADASRSTTDAMEITRTGTGRPVADADALLARGEAPSALIAYRAAAKNPPTAAEASRRLLDLLLASPETLSEAAAIAATLGTGEGQTDPGLRAAALRAAAVSAAEAGDAASAARTYAAVADEATRAGENDDADLARLAAAREWMKAGRADEARPLLEAVLAAQPDDPRAIELFAACNTDLVPAAVVAEPAPPPPEPLLEGAPPSPYPPAVTPVHGIAATQPVTALAVALAEAELAETSHRLEPAAAALRRALALLDAADPARSDVARRLATVCDKLGDDAGALSALREFLDHADAGPAVGPAWRRLVELHARRGDPQAAARALITSADDPRTGSTDPERGAALTAAAEILRKRLGLPGDAVMLLERAIALDPRSVETLDALQTTAVESSNWERLADVLERKVDVEARGPTEQKELLVQLAEVYDRQLQRAGRARDTHERALNIDARFRPSLLWLARDAWVRGDSAAAVSLYGRLAATWNDEPRAAPEVRAETHVRLALLARRSGDEGGAEREAERALSAAPDNPAALDLLIDLHEAQARHAELADVLARRIATDLGPAARADLARRRAHALERSGRPLEAAGLWRALVEHDPAALPALQRLADTLRAADDRPALFAVLEPLADALSVTGDLSAAEQVIAARAQLTDDPIMVGALVAERARLLLMLPDGAEAAMAALRATPPATLPEEGLALQADLGERRERLEEALPALEELRARARAAAHGPAIAEIEARIVDLTSRFRAQLPATVEDLEQALGNDPTNAVAAEELAVFYAQIADPRERAEALSGLLRRAQGLPPDRRKAIYAVLGESAEASGDLERAEQAYWRAATIEAEPGLRANYLVSHARVLLARGEVQTAMSELEDAIARVPHHAGALALLADLTYRTQDWTRARQLYAELEVAPDAALAIARETLVHRRAVLAEAQGDTADAEAFYRELAILNPRHAEARRSLAEIAIHRGDFGAAAVRLEEVLRLLPLDAIDQLIDVRHRLGAVYVQLGDWGSARYYLELVLGQDPARLGAIELLVEVYERLGLFKEAAQACVRLSRLHTEPRLRAAVLYRQGEILRAHLGDEAGAFDAYLKSSDLDPHFPPTMVRLVSCFWAQGDYGMLADVAADLEATGFVPEDDELEVAMQLVLGTALSKHGKDTRWTLRGRTFDAVVAARALAQVGAAKSTVPGGLDAVLDAVLAWSGPGAANAALAPALEDLVAVDPTDTGALRALARLVDRADSTAASRATHALLAFVAPDDAAVAGRLAALGSAPPATAAALRVDGPADHPDGAGALRRALAALAVPLLGLAEGRAPSADAGTLPEARADELRKLAERMGAPAVTAVVVPGADPAVTVTVSASPPLALQVTKAAAALPDADWTFLVARALEDARSGMLALRGLGRAACTEVLEGAQAALLGETPSGERSKTAARFVGDASAALPTGPARERLVADLRQILSKPPDWEAFTGAAPHTANRVALLACGSPAVALAALARDDGALSKAASGEARAAARRAFLHGAPARELVRFLFSPAYLRAAEAS
jgi:tetratricopeptide (TPR) repeat protein